MKKQFMAWLAQVAKEDLSSAYCSDKEVRENIWREASEKMEEGGYPEYTSIGYELSGRYTKAVIQKCLAKNTPNRAAKHIHITSAF